MYNALFQEVINQRLNQMKNQLKVGDKIKSFTICKIVYFSYLINYLR